MTTRRNLLLSAGAGVSSVAVTGCMNSEDAGGADDGDANGTTGANNDSSSDAGDTDEETEGSRLSADHDPWAMFGGDVGNTGHSPGISPPSGEVAWRYATDLPIHSSPAVVDAVVCFGGFDRTVHAVDANEGTEEWTTRTDGRVRSSPAVTEDHVFVGSDDEYLYALRRDGSVDWRESAGAPVRAPPVPAETPNGEVVVFGEEYVRSGATQERITLKALEYDGDDV